MIDDPSMNKFNHHHQNCKDGLLRLKDKQMFLRPLFGKTDEAGRILPATLQRKQV